MASAVVGVDAKPAHSAAASQDVRHPAAYVRPKMLDDRRPQRPVDMMRAEVVQGLLREQPL